MGALAAVTVLTGAGAAAVTAAVVGPAADDVSVVVVRLVVWATGAVVLGAPLDINTAPPTSTSAAAGTMKTKGEVLDFLLIRL